MTNTNSNQLITALYCRLSQEDEREGESNSIEKLTPEILRAFIKRIDVYEKEVRYSRTCGNTIVIQYTFQLDKN